MAHDPTDPAAALRARLAQLRAEIAERDAEAGRVERALAVLDGDRTSGTALAVKRDMPAREKVNDVRLPGAWVPHELLDKVKEHVGERGFSSFVRDAMEHELERKPVRSKVRTPAK